MMVYRIAIAIVSLFLFSEAVELNFPIDSVGITALTARIMKTAVEADSMNKKGLDALDKNDLKAAAGYFNEALRLMPDYSDAQNNLGVIKYRKGDIGGAQEIWEKLAVKDPGYAVVSYNLALIQHQEKHYDAAIRLLERALKADKQLIEAQVRLGAIYLEQNLPEKALEQLRRTYKLAPTHPDAWSFYAYSLVVNGDTSEAIAVLKKNSDKFEALKLLGRIEGARGRLGEAIAYLSKAVTLSKDPSLLLELAGAQVDAKKCSGALQTVKTYFERNIQHTADAYLLAGIAAKQCNDIRASQGYFEQGCRNYPLDGILRYNLGQLYYFQNKFDQAESTWVAVSDSLQDPMMLYMRARNAKRRNDLAAAESFVKHALELDNRAEFHDFLGLVLYGKGDTASAVQEFRKALKLNPDLRSAQMNLAFATKSTGESAGAIDTLERQLSLCKEDSCTDLAIRLATLYYYQKDLHKAMTVLSALSDHDLDERVCRFLALLYRETHDLNNEIAVLEKATKRFVTEPQTGYELAEAYLMAGRYGEAIACITQLIPRWQRSPGVLYYELGRAYVEQNELARAKECFEKCLTLNTNVVAARGFLAFIFNHQGNISQARELWKKNLGDDPSNAILWVNMGLSYEREGKYDEALNYYKKALDIKRSDPQIEIALGNVYSATGQYAEALRAYKEALNSPKRELAAYNTFLVYTKKRDKELAEKMVKILEQEFSSSVNTKRAKAEMTFWNGDTTQAVNLLEKLSEKEPADFVALAQAYATKGDRQRAEEYLAKVPSDAQWEDERRSVRTSLAFQSGEFQDVIRMVRESGDTSFAAQYNLGLACYQQKQYADALAVAEALVHRASGADRADLCRLAGNSAFGLKQWKTALQWYLQLSSIEANSAVVQYNLAVASYNLGDVENSWKYYTRAQELDPNIKNADIEKRHAAVSNTAVASTTLLATIDSLYNAAVDLQNGGNDSAAEKIYLRVVAQDSLYNMAWNNLGAIYGKWGEIEKAEHAYQKAVEKKHDIPETYANLINLCIALEDFSKARYWLIKGQGHNPESDLLKDMKGTIEKAEKKAGKSRK